MGLLGPHRRRPRRRRHRHRDHRHHGHPRQRPPRTTPQRTAVYCPARADDGDQMTQTTADPRLYVRITKELRHKISAGDIEANANVSITTLSQQWRVSRQTVSKALRALEDDRLVRRYPGVAY